MDDYEELIPLPVLLRMDRQVALRYLLNYLEANFDIEPAAGVTVRYAGENLLDPDILAENVVSGSDDGYINVYEGAFTAAGNSADLLGVLAHEITHSHQEQSIEASRGRDV